MLITEELQWITLQVTCNLVTLLEVPFRYGHM